MIACSRQRRTLQPACRLYCCEDCNVVTLWKIMHDLPRSRGSRSSEMHASSSLTWKQEASVKELTPLPVLWRCRPARQGASVTRRSTGDPAAVALTFCGAGAPSIAFAQVLPRGTVVACVYCLR